MNFQEPSMFDLLIEAHIGLDPSRPWQLGDDAPRPGICG